MTDLAPQRRGDPFEYFSALGGGWTASMFPGGFAFTLRTDIADTSQHDETDLYTDPNGSFVDQATSNGGLIVFADATNYTVSFPSSRTTNWPLARLYWDFVGKIDDDRSYTLDSGRIVIVGDVKRAP